MDTTIGTTQAALTFILASSQKLDNKFFIGKWISPELDMTAIAANTWTWNFAIKASSASNVFDYPSNKNDERIPLCCYVWRPGTGTKVGTINTTDTGLDSANNAYVDVGTNSSDSGKPTTNEWAENGTFAGSAVAGVQTGDVIVMEAWAFIDTNNANSTTYSFFYDGGTITTAANPPVVVSDHASFLQTPENLVFAGPPPPSATGRPYKSFSPNGFIPYSAAAFNTF